MRWTYKIQASKSRTICALVVLVVVVLCGLGLLPAHIANQAHGRLLAARTVSADQLMPVAASSPEFDLTQAISLTVPRLGLKFNIAPGYYNSEALGWTLDTSHLFMMEMPSGQPAAAIPVIYGVASAAHPLTGMALHEIIVITLADGRELYFENGGSHSETVDTAMYAARGSTRTAFLAVCDGPHFEQSRITQLQYLGASAPAGQPKPQS